jgi:hypothetical protein
MLADAAGNALCELTTASGRTISYQRNTYAEASFVVGHEDDAGVLLLNALRNTGVPTLRCYRRGSSPQIGPFGGPEAELVFNGYLASCSEDLSETALLTPVFRSPFARLVGDETSSGRFTNGSTVFTQTDAGTIAIALVDAANTDGETGLSTSDGVFIPTKLRDKTYSYANIGDEISALSGMLDGFDFDETFIEGGTKQSKLNIYDRQGLDRSSYAQFAYGPDTMANVQSVERQTSPPLNSVRLLGGNGLVAIAEDPQSIAKYGKWPYQGSFTDVIEQQTLNDKAWGLLRADPRKTLSFVPELGMAACPRPFDDFWLGDTVSFTGRRAGFQESQRLRVNAIRITVDDNGDEVAEIPDPLSPEAEATLKANIAVEITQ